jgi:hypothetical protein
MTLAEVLAVIPAGSRRAKDQVQALAAGMACPDLADVSGKLRDKLEQFWRVHVLHASWGGEGRAPRGVSSPGRERVCELVRDRTSGKPISVSTYKRLRRWWEARGYLAVARPGWTPDLSPSARHRPGRDRNMSQAYVICVPRRAAAKARRHLREAARPQNGPLSLFSTTEASPARPREGKPEEGTSASCCYQPSFAGQPEPPQPPPRDPGLRVGVLARVTDGWFNHLTRLFAGQSASDLLWVIDHRPDGTPHLGTDDYVRHPVGWLRHRLSFWLNPDGSRKPTPREEATGRARRHREDQTARLAVLGLTARSARIRAEHGTETAAPEPQRPWTPAGAVLTPGGAGRPSLASLALELHELKQDGQLDAQTRAAAIGRAWKARHAARQTPQDPPVTDAPAKLPAIAMASAWGGTGGYRPDPQYEAAVAIAVANVAAWEAAERANEGLDDHQEGAS